MSDFEKDNELKDKYSGVMGSIADDIRQINLEDDFAETVKFDAAETETDANALSETVEHIAVESETDADDTIEFEAIKSETAADAIEPEAIKHETGDTIEFEAIAPETEPALSETSDAPSESKFPEGSFDRFLESINRMSFNDNELQKSVLGDISESGFDNTAPINTELLKDGGLDISAEYAAYSGTDLSDNDMSAEDEYYPNTLTCDECRELLYDYVSDATDETENRAVRAHLRDCEMCRMELDEIKDMLSVLSNSTVPAPPVNLVTSVRDKLEAAAPEVKAEYKSLREKGIVPAGAIDFRSLLNTVKTKTDHFIKHANWRVLAPAALSAVLVIGVAGSGIYQVMKSSDEIYNFSDNAAIAEAGATARPSSSGLDEYVVGDDEPNSTASAKSKSTPSSAASPGAAAPRATVRPSTGTSAQAAARSSAASSTAPRATTRPSTSTSTSSRLNLNNGTTSSSRISSSTTTANRTASTTAAARTTPTPAPRAYVTPHIILPAISPNSAASPTYVAPDSIVIPDDPAPPTFSYTPPTSVPTTPAPTAAQASAASTTSGGSAGGSARTTAAPSTARPTASSSPAATNSPTASASASAATSSPSANAGGASASPSQTKDPNATAAPGVKRNDKGETEAFAQKANSMDKASVISCEITDKNVLNKLLESDLANCSKIDPATGEITLYYTGDEYLKFTGFLKENKLSYSLVVLGSNDDVKVIVTDSTKK